MTFDKKELLGLNGIKVVKHLRNHKFGIAMNSYGQAVLSKPPPWSLTHTTE